MDTVSITACRRRMRLTSSVTPDLFPPPHKATTRRRRRRTRPGAKCGFTLLYLHFAFVCDSLSLHFTTFLVTYSTTQTTTRRMTDRERSRSPEGGGDAPAPAAPAAADADAQQEQAPAPAAAAADNTNAGGSADNGGEDAEGVKLYVGNLDYGMLLLVVVGGGGVRKKEQVLSFCHIFLAESFVCTLTRSHTQLSLSLSHTHTHTIQLRTTKSSATHLDNSAKCLMCSSLSNVAHLVLVASALSLSTLALPQKTLFPKWINRNWMDVRFVSMKVVPKALVPSDLVVLVDSTPPARKKSNSMWAICRLIRRKKPSNRSLNSTDKSQIASCQPIVKLAKYVAFVSSPCPLRWLKMLVSS